MFFNEENLKVIQNILKKKELKKQEKNIKNLINANLK